MEKRGKIATSLVRLVAKRLDSLLAGSEGDDIFDDVENPIGAAIEQYHVAFQHNPFPVFREPRQAPV
jgi:hypothetical protein